MKLLFDQNLSHNLIKALDDLFPDSVHVRDIGLREASDAEIWDYAKENGYVIVSKDSDFQQRSLLYGSPPKFIWIRIGNSSVQEIEDLIRLHSITIHTFNQRQIESFLILS